MSRRPRCKDLFRGIPDTPDRRTGTPQGARAAAAAISAACERVSVSPDHVRAILEYTRLHPDATPDQVVAHFSAFDRAWSCYRLVYSTVYPAVKLVVPDSVWRILRQYNGLYNIDLPAVGITELEAGALRLEDAPVCASDPRTRGLPDQPKESRVLPASVDNITDHCFAVPGQGNEPAPFLDALREIVRDPTLVDYAYMNCAYGATLRIYSHAWFRMAPRKAQLAGVTLDSQCNPPKRRRVEYESSNGGDDGSGEASGEYPATQVRPAKRLRTASDVRRRILDNESEFENPEEYVPETPPASRRF